MATIRKLKSKKFLAEVRKLGQYKSKTFGTKIQAMAWAAEIEQSLSSDSLVGSKTLGELFERYRDEITPDKKSWRTEHNRLNKFMRHALSTLPLADIKQTHFYDWIEEARKEIKNSSVNRDLNILSSVFEQGKRWNWTDNNPIRGIKRPRNPPPRDRRISKKEIKNILDALFFDGKTVKNQQDEVAIAFLLALETAMRQGEIWGLHWQDVYLKKRYVRLHDTKNGTKRDVALSTRAVELLNLLHKPTRGEPISRNPTSEISNDKVFSSNQQSSATIFRRCLKLVNIKYMTFHDTRHEALTRLARKLDVLDLARMVGHRDPRSLMIYYNATAEEIAQRLD